LTTPKAASRPVPNPGAVSSADHTPVDIDIDVDVSVSVYVSVYVSIYVSVYISVCASVYVSVYISVCVSVYVSACASIYVAISIYVATAVCAAIAISIRERRQGLLARRTSDDGEIRHRRRGGLGANRGERHKKKGRHHKQNSSHDPLPFLVSVLVTRGAQATCETGLARLCCV
jgi:hypothetical protein